MTIDELLKLVGVMDREYSARIEDLELKVSILEDALVNLFESRK